MSEIRKHYFLDEHCIIASGRSKRPSAPKAYSDEQVSSKCAFCSGNEDQTPAATAVYKGGMILRDIDEGRIKDWDIRCIPNLYPALSPQTDNGMLSKKPTTKTLKGYGFHEVIIEGPDHRSRIQRFTDSEMLLLMKVYRDRVLHYRSHDGVEYVSLFKNWGKKAGASLEHTHSQLIAIPVMPSTMVKELVSIKQLDHCPYCRIAQNESGGERCIYENDHFIMLAPYFSRVPYEIWIVPKQHIESLSSFNDDMLSYLGDCIRRAVTLLDKAIPGLAYNYMFFQDQDPDYHLNVRIAPVTSIAAGFEMNTGIYINSTSPETAVKHLLENT